LHADGIDDHRRGRRRFEYILIFAIITIRCQLVQPVEVRVKWCVIIVASVEGRDVFK
jgi:hypothetical protein